MTSRTCTATWMRPASGLLLLGLLGAGVARAQELPPDAVARVGSVSITRGALQAELARGRLRSPAAVLARLVHVELLRQGLTAAGWDPSKVTDEQVAAARETIVRRGLPREQVDDYSRLELAIGHCLEGWMDTQLDEATLRRAWDEQRLQVVGRLRAAVVLLHQRRDAPAGEALTRARKLLGELGGKDPGAEGFAQLAAQRSDDPAAAVTGGDVDWFNAGGQSALGERLPPGLVRACYGRGEPGLIAEPIVSGDDVYLARVTAVHLPGDSDFAAHRDEARLLATGEIQRRAIGEWRARFPVRYAADAPRGDAGFPADGGRDE